MEKKWQMVCGKSLLHWSLKGDPLELSTGTCSQKLISVIQGNFLSKHPCNTNKKWNMCRGKIQAYTKINKICATKTIQIYGIMNTCIIGNGSQDTYICNKYKYKFKWKDKSYDDYHASSVREADEEYLQLKDRMSAAKNVRFHSLSSSSASAQIKIKIKI